MAQVDEPEKRAPSGRRLGVRLIQAAVLGLIAYGVMVRTRSTSQGAAAIAKLAHDETGVARPEQREPSPPAKPWLLGEGRWMAIAVPTVLLVLLLSLVLPHAPSHPIPTPPPPPLRAAPPRQDIPAGGQGPIGADESDWITADDYPPDSIGVEETGKVLIRWQVTADGTVTDCGVVQSSGHPRLDHAACDAIVRRGSYRPARDASGWPIAVTRERRVVWQLPK